MTDEKEDRLLPKRLWISLLLGVVATFLFFELFGGKSPDAEYIPTIRSYQDYLANLQQVEELLRPIWPKLEQDQGLSANEEAALKKAQGKVEALIIFSNPPRPSLYLLAGRICFAQQDYKAAIQQLDTCLRTPDPNLSDERPYVEISADAHYYGSRCLFLLQDYRKAAEQALQACELAPEVGRYYFAQAQAYAQLGADQTALKLIQECLDREPNYEPAWQLKRLILKTPPGTSLRPPEKMG